MNKRFLRILLYCILSLQSLCSYSQSAILNKYNIENKNFVDTIPIEFIHNRIFVPVTIDGHVYKFVLDTGASGCSVFKENLVSRYDSIGNINYNDINNITKKILVIKVSDLKIDKIDFREFPIVALDMPGSCTWSDGTIGVDILRDKILKIDIRNKIMILTDRKIFFEKENGFTLPFKTSYNTSYPYFFVEPIKNHKDYVFLDTGNPSFYIMGQQYYNKLIGEKIQLPIIDEGLGHLYLGLWGTSKDTTSFKFRLDDFTLGSFAVKNVNTTPNNFPVSSIGSDILNSVSLVLDYVHKKLIFTPYNDKGTIVSTYEEPPFNLIHENGEIKIMMVWKNSDAYRSGLRNGFIVKSINGLSTNDACDFLKQMINLKGNFTMECLDLKNNPVTFHLVK